MLLLYKIFYLYVEVAEKPQTVRIKWVRIQSWHPFSLL